MNKPLKLSVTKKLKMIGSKEALQIWQRKLKANESHVVQKTKRVSVVVLAKSLPELGAVINFERGPAIIRNLELKNVVKMERKLAGHLWMNLSEQMPVDSDNRMSI